MTQYDAPRSGRSPWFYVGIGCLVLFVLTLGGCLVAGTMLFKATEKIVKQAETDAKKPVTKEMIVQGLQDVPLYPGATLQTDESYRTARAIFKRMSLLKVFKKVEMAQLVTKETPKTVLDWYEKKLTSAGYISLNRKTRASKKGDTRSVLQVQKANPDGGTDLVMITVEPDFAHPETEASKDAKTPQNGKTQITVMRFDGIQQGFNPDSLKTPNDDSSEQATDEGEASR